MSTTKNSSAVRETPASVMARLEASIEKRAVEYQRRADVSKEIALARTWEENPQLYAEYKRAHRAVCVRAAAGLGC